MFFDKKIDVKMIDPSSKASLKMSCLMAANGDIRKAKEAYDFFVDGMEDIPDFPLPQPTLMQQTQQTVGNIFGWVKDNQNDLMQAWNFIQSMRGGVPLSAPVPPADIPPLPPT